MLVHLLVHNSESSHSRSSLIFLASKGTSDKDAAPKPTRSKKPNPYRVNNNGC